MPVNNMIRQEASHRASCRQARGGGDADEAAGSLILLDDETNDNVHHQRMAQTENRNVEQHHHGQQQTRADYALLARHEWRNHGTGATQALEEQRLAQQQHPNALSVRVIAAQTRVDVAGKEYMAYVLRVLHRQREILLEHRYSEFRKLYETLQAHDVTVDAAFPGRSWAGRVGHWTPSALWAPAQHEELIQDRLKQLDVWLTQLTELYNSAQLPATVQTALYQFLTQPTPLPCHQAVKSPNNNTINWWKTYNPVSFTLGSAIRQAVWMVDHMCRPYSLRNPTSTMPTAAASSSSSPLQAEPLQQSDQSIPVDLLRAAKGIMFMTVAKAGLVVSGRVGTGLILKRVAKSNDAKSKSAEEQVPEWSAPVAVGTMGMGWGFLAGGDVTHYLVVFTTEKAVMDLVQNQNSVQLGAELAVAVGPVGRGANGHLQSGDWTLHPAYAYAHSRGLFAGMSLEGSFLSVRNDVNAKFYGSTDRSAKELLLQPQQGCTAAEPLYEALTRAMQLELHRHSFRPSQLLFSDDNDNSHNKRKPLPPIFVSQPVAGSTERPVQDSLYFHQDSTATPNSTRSSLWQGHGSLLEHSSHSVSTVGTLSPHGGGASPPQF